MVSALCESFGVFQVDYSVEKLFPQYVQLNSFSLMTDLSVFLFFPVLKALVLRVELVSYGEPEYGWARLSLPPICFTEGPCCCCWGSYV